MPGTSPRLGQFKVRFACEQIASELQQKVMHENKWCLLSNGIKHDKKECTTSLMIQQLQETDFLSHKRLSPTHVGVLFLLGFHFPGIRLISFLVDKVVISSVFISSCSQSWPEISPISWLLSQSSQQSRLSLLEDDKSYFDKDSVQLRKSAHLSNSAKRSQFAPNPASFIPAWSFPWCGCISTQIYKKDTI